MTRINVTDGGKYDEAAAAARAISGGNVLLIVIGGVKGQGFCCHCEDPRVLDALPDVLDEVSRSIRRQLTAPEN